MEAYWLRMWRGGMCRLPWWVGHMSGCWKTWLWCRLMLLTDVEVC
jgi:hypothetical protein